MATATKVKVCKRFYHDGTERKLCNRPYIGDKCTAVEHFLKFKTGFCNIGSCEGTRPKGHKDKPLPTCSFYMTCPCECHTKLDKMFKDIGETRILIENPEYQPEVTEFNIEDYINTGDSRDASMGGGVIGPDGVEWPATSQPARSPDALATRRTETGRAARGGLEAQVWQMIVTFNEKGLGEFITPRILADAIAEEHKIPTPSTGAIGAVFNRWESLGFASQTKKPVKFGGFLGKGTWEELIILKGKAKRQRKQAKSAERRGFRLTS